MCNVSFTVSCLYKLRGKLISGLSLQRSTGYSIDEVLLFYPPSNENSKGSLISYREASLVMSLSEILRTKQFGLVLQQHVA